eukprot:g1740.t1
MEVRGPGAEATVIADHRHNANYLLPDMRAGVLFLYSPLFLIMNAYMAFLFAVMVFNVQVTSAVTGGYFASLSACWITVQYVTFAHQDVSSAMYVNGFAAVVLLLFWTTVYYPEPRSFVRLCVLCRAGLTFLFYAFSGTILLGDYGFLWLIDMVDSYEAASTKENAALYAAILRALVFFFVFQVFNPVAETFVIRSFTAAARNNLESQACFFASGVEENEAGAEVGDGETQKLGNKDEVDAPCTCPNRGDEDDKTKTVVGIGNEGTSSGDGTGDNAETQSGRHVSDINDALGSCSTPRRSRELNHTTRRAYLFRVKYWGYYLFYFYKIAFGRRLLFRAGWGWLLLCVIAKDVASHILQFAVRILDPCIVLHAKFLASEQLSKRRPWLCGFVRWWDDSPLSEWLLGGWTYHYDVTTLFKDTGSDAADRNDADDDEPPEASLAPPAVSLSRSDQQDDDAEASETDGVAAPQKVLIYEI